MRTGPDLLKAVLLATIQLREMLPGPAKLTATIAPVTVSPIAGNTTVMDVIFITARTETDKRRITAPTSVSPSA